LSRHRLSKTTSTLIDVPSISAGGEAHTDLELQTVQDIILTVRVTYHSSATSGVRVYILASQDGSSWDSENVTDAYAYFEPSFQAGQTRQATAVLTKTPPQVRILVRNLDSSYPTGAVKAWVTLIPRG